jgi:hypothetical protein
MKTGSTGTFVISWSQTEVDGCKAAHLDVLLVGATWRWSGMPVRVDGPQSHLLLEGAEGVSVLRQRAARTVRRLVGAAMATNGQQTATLPFADDGVPEQGFIVTDGHKSYALTIINVPDTNTRLLMIVGHLPPVDRDLWVVRIDIDRNNLVPGKAQAGGVICFTPGTYIATPSGPRLIQTLRPGELIQTKDNGPQAVLWSGSRRMSGARLYAMPHLRPVRFRSGAFGIGRPDGDLLVSPQHRMLLKGPAAVALFNTSEVLVRAEDLINDISITVDRTEREVTYIHVLLERHNIVFANGIETESFHPSNTALDTVDVGQREALLRLLPDVADHPQSYGDYARRNLSSSEAAILRHDMAS